MIAEAEAAFREGIRLKQAACLPLSPIFGGPLYACSRGFVVATNGCDRGDRAGGVSSMDRAAAGL
jgi:hypothetical protein